MAFISLSEKLAIILLSSGIASLIPLFIFCSIINKIGGTSLHWALIFIPPLFPIELFLQIGDSRDKANYLRKTKSKKYFIKQIKNHTKKLNVFEKKLEKTRYHRYKNEYDSMIEEYRKRRIQEEIESSRRLEEIEKKELENNEYAKERLEYWKDYYASLRPGAPVNRELSASEMDSYIAKNGTSNIDTDPNLTRDQKKAIKDRELFYWD